jgi:hypothetical protein
MCWFLTSSSSSSPSIFFFKLKLGLEVLPWNFKDWKIGSSFLPWN